MISSICALLAALFFCSQPVYGEAVMLVDQEGKYCTLELDQNERGLLEEMGFKTSTRHGQNLGYPRNYDAPLTASEISDIRYIVTSLSSRSLVYLLSNRGDFEAAGDRLDHLHPLKFLMAIFVDEEMKAAIRNIRGRGWVWGNFIAGFKDSFSTEDSLGNVRKDQVMDFAQNVEVDFQLVYPSFQRKNWEECINLLIEYVPRKGDHDRYGD